jgi:hypothetical protein
LPANRSSGDVDAPTMGAVSARQVRLLYKTTCWTCGAPIAAGTTTWWDDERSHATCTTCVQYDEERVDEASPAPIALDRRTRRRLEIMRAHRPRIASR